MRVRGQNGGANGLGFSSTGLEENSGTGPDVGATVPIAVERRAGVLGRSAPSIRPPNRHTPT